MVFSLTDGTRVRLRPIRPDDKDLLAAGLTQLSQETVRRRFMAAKPRFSSSELRYLTEVDGVNHIALVAEPVEGPPRIYAVARAIRLPDQPDTAEWAIVVADPLQGKGLGRLLAHAIAGEAQQVGIRRFSATMLGDNVAVHRLLGTIADRFERDEIHNGVRQVLVDLAA